MSVGRAHCIDALTWKNWICRPCREPLVTQSIWIRMKQRPPGLKKCTSFDGHLRKAPEVCHSGFVLHYYRSTVAPKFRQIWLLNIIIFLATKRKADGWFTEQWLKSQSAFSIQGWTGAFRAWGSVTCSQRAPTLGKNTQRVANQSENLGFPAVEMQLPKRWAPTPFYVE